MIRQLPVVDIAGTAFYVDVVHDELRQKDNPQNRISFNVFDQDGNGYTFLYDGKRKNVPENKAELDKMEEGMQWVTLPALMELDPEGIALKYDIPLSVLCPELTLQNDLNDDEQHYYGDEIYE
jgi:hypothetical protein